MNKAVEYICLALFVAVMCFVGLRIYAVNQKYPPAEVVTYGIGDVIEFSEMNMTVTASRIDYAANIVENYEVEIFDKNYNLLSEDECMLLVVDLAIENTTNSEITVPLYVINAESGGWSNGIDATDFRKLNIDLEQPVITISAGETAYVSVPFAMYSIQFKDSAWSAVDSMEYSIVFSVYPVMITVVL